LPKLYARDNGWENSIGIIAQGVWLKVQCRTRKAKRRYSSRYNTSSAIFHTQHDPQHSNWQANQAKETLISVEN